MDVEGTGAEPETGEQPEGWVLPPPHLESPALTAWPFSEEPDRGGAERRPSDLRRPGKRPASG
jgi:hypothetical protein